MSEGTTVPSFCYSPLKIRDGLQTIVSEVERLTRPFYIAMSEQHIAYRHEALSQEIDGNHVIRLLELLPSDHSAQPLGSTIREAHVKRSAPSEMYETLSSEPNEALSYFCGDTSPVDRLWCGQECIDIGANGKLPLVIRVDATGILRLLGDSHVQGMMQDEQYRDDLCVDIRLA